MTVIKSLVPWATLEVPFAIAVVVSLKLPNLYFVAGGTGYNGLLFKITYT